MGTQAGAGLDAVSRQRAAETDARLLAVAGAGDDDLDVLVAWTVRALRGTTSVVLTPDRAADCL